MNRFRFAIAVLASGALVLAAPFISQFRNYLRATLPDHFVIVLGGIVAACVGLAVIGALFAIRQRRPLRYGLIAAALAIGTSYSLLTSSPDPHIAVVERFHFVQYGLITFLFYRAWRPLGDAGVLILPVLAAMLTATAEEWFQWFIPGRVGVMDDVFLNWVAIVCGLLFSIGLDPFDADAAAARPARAGSSAASTNAFALGRRSVRHCGIAAALFVIVFGMFFDSVHLGYRIDDPRIGSFTSIYTAPDLQVLARDRTPRWQMNPPVDKTRLAREDQYRTEGIQHVQERNEAWDRGDFAVAWGENLILETYYAPVLQRGHEWPSGQRADASVRVAADGGAAAKSFVSHAYPYEIYTWPPGAFRACIIVIAGGLLWVGRQAAARRDRTPAPVGFNP